MKQTPISCRGATLVATILVIASLSLVMGVYYRALPPKFRSIYQGASWQEALHGAEAGADYALQTLNTFAATTKDSSSYPWTGWTTVNLPYSASSHPANRERRLDAPPVLGGTNNVEVLNVTVDVYTRDTTLQNNPWYRIRSTARADVPGRQVSSDRRDGELRRMKLANLTAGESDPYVTRTVEIIAQPKYRFAHAITTRADMALGGSSNWQVDSFDSTDTAKSSPGTKAGGLYPESTPAEIQSNGSIATLNPLPTGVLYGPLIDGNGAVVKGEVSTAGGDNPDTAAHENVEDSSGFDPARIHDDFEDTLDPVTKPAWLLWSPNPPENTNFQTSTDATAPMRYITGNLGSFAVTAPIGNKTGFIEIIVNGNLNIGSGGSAAIVIPPNVYATIYVNGNIDFGNGLVNADPASSQVATHLTVYGVAPRGTYTASGNAVQILSFYGPNYNVDFNGTVKSIGSVVGNNFTISGGGGGGFHYDEALGKGGDIGGWTVASYFEDSRLDLE